MQVRNRFLHLGYARTETEPFEACSDRDLALQVFSLHLRLTGKLCDVRQCAKGSRATGGTDQESIAHALKRAAILLRKAHSNGVRTVVDDHGCRCWRS